VAGGGGVGLVVFRFGLAGTVRLEGCVAAGRSSIGATGGSSSELLATATNTTPTATPPISSPRKNRFIHSIVAALDEPTVRRG
jgi:hypothetical protein